MVAILRRLQISDVSSVDMGASGNSQVRPRVILAKRDPESRIRDAVRALEKSVASIMEDADVVDKQALVAESLAQFHEYIGGIDPGAGAAAAAAIAKHARKEEPPMSFVEKAERS